MIPSILWGAGAGVGLWILLAWALPRPALRARWTFASAPAADPIRTPTDDPPASAGWRGLVPALRALGLPNSRLANDLRITGRSSETHVAVKVMLALTGLCVPWLALLMLATGGLPAGLEIPALTSAGLACVGFVAPDVEVRSRAARQRREFRNALSAYLDLVWITLAGGAGVEAALLHAADVGHGPTFDKLRSALHAAHLTRTTPWFRLRQLGEELDISALSELATVITLAGTEGAVIRSSLAAKAQALRTHQVTDAEADAQSATERMALPVTLLFLGFLVFIAYPALTQVLNGL